MTESDQNVWRGGLTQDLSQVLMSEAQIQSRVAELGRMLTKDYQEKDPLLVGILSGSFLFHADLVRNMNLPLAVDFMAVSSYGDRTSSSGVVRILKDLNSSIAGRHVIIIEDIVDTGLTLDYPRDLGVRRPTVGEVERHLAQARDVADRLRRGMGGTRSRGGRDQRHEQRASHDSTASIGLAVS